MTQIDSQPPEPLPLDSSAPTAALGPVEPAARMFELDMLRGWAVLGILAVNAIAFAWPFTLSFDINLAPFAMAGADRIGTWVVDVFFSDKFRTLFSLLFGVSIFLVGGERSDLARGKLLRRRLFWLGLIGLAHGAALWFGDILMHYAYCGLIMMLLRSWPVSRLLWVGGGITFAWAVIGGVLGYVGALMGDMSGGGDGGPFAPTAESIQASIALYQSGWPGAAIENLKAWAFVQAFSVVLIPATVPLMMLGLGLYKAGFLTGRSHATAYLGVIALGAAALAFNGWAHWNSIGAPAEAVTAHALSALAGALAPFIMLGYVAALVLLTRWGLKAVTRIFAPVGQMAFTNYLSQTLIMTTIFYMPWGPQLFGQVGPAGLWGFVVAIWAAQIIWSPLWLSRFRLGPLEWLWRCLTYGRWVPIVRARG